MMERRGETRRHGEPGVLRRVDPREGWAHGPYEFAPWLEERPGLLGDELGVDLTLQADPRLPVGFLTGQARVPSGSETYHVLMLSQLGRADDSHLGRLLAGLRSADADFAVWVAVDFPEEQREVLRWLDERMDIALFGVELSVLAIDDSRPAVGLDCVVESATWRRPPQGRTATPSAAAALAGPAKPVSATDLRIARGDSERRGVSVLRVGLTVDLGDLRANET